MAKLTYADLVKQGVHLTKDEATALQSGVTHISKFGSDGMNDLFDYDKTGNQNASTAGGLGSIKQTPGFEPNGGNSDDDNSSPKKPETAKQKKEREAAEKKATEEQEANDKRIAALKEAGLEEREVTEQDLIDEPDLVTQGVKVGDVHEFPIAEA